MGSCEIQSLSSCARWVRNWPRVKCRSGSSGGDPGPSSQSPRGGDTGEPRAVSQCGGAGAAGGGRSPRPPDTRIGISRNPVSVRAALTELTHAHTGRESTLASNTEQAAAAPGALEAGGAGTAGVWWSLEDLGNSSASFLRLGEAECRGLGPYGEAAAAAATLALLRAGILSLSPVLGSRERRGMAGAGTGLTRVRLEVTVVVMVRSWCGCRQLRPGADWSSGQLALPGPAAP